MRAVLGTGRGFLAANLVAIVAVAAMAAVVVVGRFADRRAGVAEMADALQKLDAAHARTTLLTREIAGRGNPFLSASDERLGSADLQALLQDLTRTGGASFLGVRSVPAPRRPDLKAVAAKLEFEGSLAAVQAVVEAIESHVPLLWIDAASIRDAGSGDEPGTSLHAELQVEAALATAPPPGATARPMADPLGPGSAGALKP